YDESGKSAKKFLVRKPVADGNITSGFGGRNHPLLGYDKMHTGVDWASSTGTPGFAAGTGVIDKIGWEGGYGKYIRTRHANGYETAYGHLSAFARSMEAGKRVHQGQIIGYVGSTGLSTGAHLHYEIMVNGRFVDPMRIKLPRGRVLEGPVLAGFERERDRLEAMISRAPARMAQTGQAASREAAGVLRRLRGRLAVDHESVGTGGDHGALAVLDAPRKNERGERILHRFLDHPLERPGAVGRIPALLGEPFACGGLEHDRDLAILEQLYEPPHLDVDDAAHLRTLEAMEQDDLVDAVEELRPQTRAHRRHDLIAHGVGILAVGLIDQIFGAEIRGHHDQRVAEVDGMPLPVREPSVVEHLEQHVEDVRVRLLDLVEQHDLVGPSTHRLGERAAFLVADVAGRRADQPRDRMLLHVLGHVDADQRLLVVEQKLAERLGALGLAAPGRP